MADGVRTNFMVFPNIRICLAPCGNGYHRLGVVDSPGFCHRSRRDARPCVSTITRVYGHIVCSYNCRPCASKTIIAVHVSTIIPVRPYKYTHTRSRNKSRACPNNYHRAHFNNYPHPSMQMFSYVPVMIPVRLCAHIALCFNVVLCTLQQSLPMRSGRVL